MTRTASTQFGEPLSAESKKLVNELRTRLTQPIHPKFNTDFNLYRFVMNAERQHNKTKDILEHATKDLNMHLRYRSCLHLDELEDVPFSKNPIFRRRFLPTGSIREETDSCGRALWYVDYETISIEGIAHALRSSAACRYQFWQFEHMLRRVNRQEADTGKLSSLRHVVDMTGYEINPFMMLFVSNGALSYYSQLFHYENYPDLVYPIEIVNIAKWVHMPYKLVKAMMPSGFSDRFRLYDNQFLDTLKQEIDVDNIPVSLGGHNTDMKCIPADPFTPDMAWHPTATRVLDQLESMHVSAKKQKVFKLDLPEGQRRTLSWYFKSDGDIFFGVFYDPTHHLSATTPVSGKKDKKDKEEKEKELDLDTKEMMYPLLKISAKIVHEFDFVDLEKAGTYYVMFCNRHSWLHRRTVDVLVQTSAADGSDCRRLSLDGTQTPVLPEDAMLTVMDLRNYRD